MKVIPITSDANPLLKQVRGLQQRNSREKSGLFLIEGQTVIGEALEAGIELKDVIMSQTYWQSAGGAHDLDFDRVSLVEDRLFAQLVTTDSSCGIVATANHLQWSQNDLFTKGQVPLLLIAESIQDPGNLGTMMRTCLAADASAMIMTKGTVDPYNSKVVRSAAGALFNLPFVCGLSIDQAIGLAKNRGLQILACTQEAQTPYWEANLKQPTALVFGNEGQGFTTDTLSRCDQQISIPMSSRSESLNVAIATGIILFGAVQQRRQEIKV